MTVQLAELTRDQIQELAPTAVAVLPTASIEQHGPHMPVVTDTLLCGTVAERAAQQASNQAPVLVAPVLWSGNSHHHFPFAGVLSLPGPNYIATVIDVLEGLVKSGFRKLVILNGHGGNTDSNKVVALDMANRLGHPVRIAAAAYWDLARAAIVDKDLLPSTVIPGHAGRFETSLMMAIRPDLVNQAGLSRTQAVPAEQGLFASFAGATVQVHGAWQAGPGYTDDPQAATAQEGAQLLDIIVEQVSEFLIAFHHSE